jgi:hypothetical protein
MLVKPQRARYQWIYEPKQQFLLFLPRLQDIDTSARTLLFKIFKSLELETYMALLNGDKTAFESYACLADAQEFLQLIQRLKPKWVSIYGDIDCYYPGIYRFPHPNIWQEDWHLKKRIWLAWHDLKHKVL